MTDAHIGIGGLIGLLYGFYPLQQGRRRAFFRQPAGSIPKDRLRRLGQQRLCQEALQMFENGEQLLPLKLFQLA